VFGQGQAFDRYWLVEQARGLAAAPFEEHRPRASDLLRGLDSGQYHAIRFKPAEALWAGQGLPFEAQFFPLGHYFDRPVAISEAAEAKARLLHYDPGLFESPDPAWLGSNDEGSGFAGFRLLTPLNLPGVYDEVISFLGASYFRAVGAGELYGLSARGIAVNTATAGGEEFPSFIAFWLQRPDAGRSEAVVHALLDGPSLTGAYTFTVRPGPSTEVDVQAEIFPRQPIERLGIAPLTSMFFFGPNDRVGIDDMRPAVHDSEGLSMWTGAGEWLWRPLVNPARVRVSSFVDDNPRGFGLLQRARDFAHYQDLDRRYERRPSAWVEPAGAWGRGAVQLVEIPTPSENHDNIVAYWVPEAPVEPGMQMALAYRITWGAEAPRRPVGAEVVATRIGAALDAGSLEPREDAQRIAVDFRGGRLDELEAGTPVGADVWTSRGAVENLVVRRIGREEGWRAEFDFKPEGDEPIELRCTLNLSDRTPLGETWSYQWTA